MTKRKRATYDVGVIYGDVHDPYCDEPAFEMFLEAVKLIKPNFVVENGDGFNSEGFASFIQNPGAQCSVNSELKQFKARREMVLDVTGKDCLCTYLPGTHEYWMADYLVKHPEMDREENQWYNILGLQEMGWNYLDFEGRKQPVLDIGKLLVTHGTIARMHSGYSARASLDMYGSSVLVNHTHRLGAHWRTNISTTHVAYENGCMCTEHAGKGYMRHRSLNWQQGWSVIIVDRQTGWFRVDQIPILRVPGENKKRVFLHEGLLECQIR